MKNWANHKFSILEKMQAQDTLKKKSTIPICLSKHFWSLNVACIYWCLRLKCTLVPLKKQLLLNHAINKIAASNLTTATAIKISTSANKRMTCKDFSLNQQINLQLFHCHKVAVIVTQRQEVKFYTCPNAKAMTTGNLIIFSRLLKFHHSSIF